MEKPAKGESIAMTAPVRMEMPGSKPESIAMTAPVRMQQSSAAAGAAEADADRMYKLSFTMPHKYTRETLPQPNNPNVMIR